MTSFQSGALRTFPRYLATLSALDSVSSLSSPSLFLRYIYSNLQAIYLPILRYFRSSLSELLFSAISSSLSNSYSSSAFVLPSHCNVPSLRLPDTRALSPPSSNPCYSLSNSPLLLACVLQGIFLLYFKSCDQSLFFFFTVVNEAFPGFILTDLHHSCLSCCFLSSCYCGCFQRFP